MHPYPHRYTAEASGFARGLTEVTSPGLSPMQVAPPPQFDGPEGLWSPETLLTAAIADCFVLTFRSLARARGLAWSALSCRAEATLDRVQGQAQFSRVELFTTLTLEAADALPLAQSLLQAAERGCLISNSLRAERTLHTDIRCSALSAA